MLKIEDLHKTFDTGTINEKVVLNGIDLTLQDGDFVTVIGSNGAGKSTLLNAIAGVFIADKGKILIDDKDITKLKEHERAKYIGRVFQDPNRGTASDMWIEENLALAYMRATTKTHIFSCISKKEEEGFKLALKELDMGLEDRLDTPVGTLSGGQRQALTLLMATIVPPKILLLDEHTAALDPIAAQKVMNLTNKIVKENKITCLMITHDMKIALSTGNKTILMHDGNIVCKLDEQQKQNMKVEDLINKFHDALNDDRILLDN